MGKSLLRSRSHHGDASNLSSDVKFEMRSTELDILSDVSPTYIPMETWRIVLCAMAMCGIQVCYAAQINMGTAELLLLGMSERAVSLAWLAGPISGLLVQPLVGYASDNCTSRLGRRRPFLLAGTIFTAASLLLFCNARNIAKTIAPSGGAPRVALALAVCAFFLLDFSIQAIQAPLRALVTDVVPQPQRATANAYIAVFTGVGNFLGGLLAAVRLSAIFTFYQNDVQALFTTAAFILIATVFACVLATPEVPIRVESYSPISEANSQPTAATALLPANHPARIDDDDESPRERIWNALANVPRPFWQVFTVQLFTWCGFFALFVYVNTWVGRNIYLGDGTAPAGSFKREVFEKGVRLGGKGNALTALVTLGYALALPTLLNQFGVLKTYAFSQVIEACCLMLAPFLRGVAGQKYPSTFLRLATLLDIGMFGIVWATTMGVPWTLIGNALESDDKYASQMGLYTTLFNASQSFPQLIVAFGAPVVLDAFNNDPSIVMFIGGVCALIGGILVYTLRVDLYNTSRESNVNENEFFPAYSVVGETSSRGRSFDSITDGQSLMEDDRWRL